MKKRDILIVIAVIAFGIIYNSIRRGDIDFYSGIPDRDWQLKDKNYPYDYTREEIRLTAGEVDKIEIRNLAGDIEVEKAAAADTGTIGMDNPGIRIQPVIRVYHKKKQKAEEISQQIQILTSKTTETTPGQDGDLGQKQLLRIEVKSEDDFPYRRARVHFKVVIPETLELSLLTRYGDIAVDGCGKVIHLDEKYGDIAVKNVDSDLKINHKEGRVAISEVKGHIDLSCRKSRIKIAGVSGLRLDCRLSTVNIYQVEVSTQIDDAAYSAIILEEANGCSIEGRQTKIKLRNIKNDVQVKNSHHSIGMENISGNIRVNANNCRIDLEKITSEDVVIKNSYKYVSIDEISAANLDVSMDNGDLDIAVDQIREKINIKNRHSKITLMYPPEVQPSFNIQVLYGSIANRTPGELTVYKESTRQVANSAQQDNKPVIIIDNTYGDVSLENRERKNNGNSQETTAVQNQ